MELWNKRYYISTLLNYLDDISYNPWDIGVHKRIYPHVC